MQVRIKATRMELTPAIRAYVQEKMDMLEKYLGNIQVINCDFEVDIPVGGQHKGDIFRAELNLQLPGELIRIDKTEKDLYKAIDKVKDHVLRSIKRHKEKKIDRKRGK